MNSVNTGNKKLIIFQWVVIAVFFVLILLFLRQNIRLKSRNSHENRPAPQLKARLFEAKLAERFLFKGFPMQFDKEEFSFSDESPGMEYINGYIVMVFDLTVCGNCLHEELAVLGVFRENAAGQHLAFRAIIGIIDKKEESEIINMHRSGEIFFPCKMIDVDTLYRTFKLDKENFLDTPFYLYVSHDFKVLDIFKPPYLDTKELNTWLTIITGQDFL